MLPHVASVEQALAGDGAAGVHRRQRPRRAQTQETGDLAAGFKAGGAHDRSRPTRRTSSRTSASSRTARVCEWDGDKLTAWVSTQGVNGAREGFASALEHSAGQRPRHHQYMGGGFGSKFGAGRRRASSARKLAKAGERAGQADARSQGRASRHRQPSVGRGADQGRRRRPTACSPRSTPSWGTGGAGAASGFPLPYIYQFPNRRRTHKDVYINAGQQRADARAGPSAGLASSPKS